MHLQEEDFVAYDFGEYKSLPKSYKKKYYWSKDYNTYRGHFMAGWKKTSPNSREEVKSRRKKYRDWKRWQDKYGFFAALAKEIFPSPPLIIIVFILLLGLFLLLI